MVERFISVYVVLNNSGNLDKGKKNAKHIKINVTDCRVCSNSDVNSILDIGRTTKLHSY